MTGVSRKGPTGRLRCIRLGFPIVDDALSGFDVVQRGPRDRPAAPADRPPAVGRGADRRGRLRPRRAAALLGRALAERPRAGRSPGARATWRAAGWWSSAAASACPPSSPPSSGRATLATDWYAPRARLHPRQRRCVRAPGSRRCWWTGATRPAELLDRAPRRSRRRGGRRSTRSATGPPSPRSCPASSAPAGEVLIADPRRPHAAGPARSADRRGLVARLRGRAPRGRASTSAGPSSGSTA